MTILDNSIRINAPPEKVWSVLAALDVLQEYDPGIAKCQTVLPSREGVGAARQCDLTPGGWFKERISEWKPHETLTFELFECTLPVRKLRHGYTLKPEGGGTVVTQRMEYELKFGPIGKLMDAVMVRRKFDAGIKGFFAGLKQYVETGKRPQGKR